MRKRKKDTEAEEMSPTFSLIPHAQQREKKKNKKHNELKKNTKQNKILIFLEG